ncbi:hypothetical protein ACHAPV_008379 [Trichoderma viride]
MRAQLNLLRVLLAAYLSTLVAGDRFVTLTRGYDGYNLLKRQDDSLDSNCFYACEVSACGSSCAPVQKRDFSEVEKRDRQYRLWNETTDSWSEVSAAVYEAHLSRRALEKRVFITNPRWNAARVAKYLPGQIALNSNGQVVPADTQFPTNEGFFIGGTNQGTVAVLREFGNDPIQLGTGGLHGCTMLAVVSTRAVYMAHYWETYTTGLNDNIAAGSADLANWQTKVLNSITGTGTQDPNAQADALNWNLFNQPGDNTRVMIMSPNNEISTSLKYKNKVGLIQSLLQDNIPGVNIVQPKAYTRLNYRVANGVYVGPDASKVDESERGIALFQ